MPDIVNDAGYGLGERRSVLSSPASSSAGSPLTLL